jgi:Zn-dependent protease/predicted transcriptional regulator
MRDGIRLGRLFGISLSLDFSWILIFLLITWNLTRMFWQWHPAWGMGNLGVAIAASLLFFASVLAHEFGHALVATAWGLPVREIRLFLFGGVSNIEREPPSPLAEFVIAIVGPAVSFAIGTFCILISGFFLRGNSLANPAAILAGLDPLSTIILWLGPINMIIGAFNLSPGFPLDGGRVLRAALWSITGDLKRATRWAGATGQAIGWSFVALGIAMVVGVRVPFFGRGAGGGLWLALIGWFLSSAASRSYQGLLVQEALDGITVHQLMRRSGPVIDADTPIGTMVSEWFMRAGEHVLPVFRDGNLVGIVSTTDLHRVPRESWDVTKVAAIMTPREKLFTIGPSDTATTAMKTLVERGVEQLPVLADGQLVGMLDRSAVARWLDIELASTRAGKPHQPRTA